MSLRRLLVAVATSVVLAACAGSSDTVEVADTASPVLTTMVAPDATSVDTTPVATAEADEVVPSGTEAPAASDSGSYEPFSDLPLISVDELPPEAIDTLVLIDEGGPFPYRQDDSVFQNRERILPQRERGHYREYTVETPGSDDRGARRIVAGDDGERYWTDDHYDSFSEIYDWGGEP